MAYAAADETEEDLYQKCKSAYTEKDKEKVSQYADKFSSLYSQSEKNPEVYFMKAFLQTDANASIDAYKRIIDKYPKNMWAGRSHFQLGQIYYLQGKYKESSEQYSKIVVYFTEDDEIYWKARYWRCKTLIATGDYTGAIYALESLQNSSNKEIGSDAILLSLGQCYFGNKDYDKAEATFRKLIETMPKSESVPTFHLLLAKTLQGQGKLEDAKAQYSKIVESYGKSIEAKQAKESLDSMAQAQKNPAERDRNPVKVSPQLEWQFIEKSDKTKDSAVTTQEKPSDPNPPFQVKWKDDKEENPYYSIQVGAFSKSSGAESLAKRLSSQKYEVEIFNPPPGESPSLYKVRVGKYKTESEARKAAQDLNKSENIESKIVFVKGR